MNSMRAVTICLALAACQDEPVATTGPTPPPLQEGVSAYITVDRLDARPGQTVRVRVEVQVGSQQNFKVGSYTGRLRFDPQRLQFRVENAISDGLRVSNPNGAPRGEIRFAGASAAGFNQLVLYDGSFEVRQAGYVEGLSLQMEELSAALSLQNLAPQLRVNPRVFLSRTATQP
jgi:hypothetical protein